MFVTARSVGMVCSREQRCCTLSVNVRVSDAMNGSTRETYDHQEEREDEFEHISVERRCSAPVGAGASRRAWRGKTRGRRLRAHVMGVRVGFARGRTRNTLHRHDGEADKKGEEQGFINVATVRG